MKNTKVTVIIPCFNDGKYIDDAIQSIIHQTYKDWELIVVDDGSTDTYTIEKINKLDYPKTKVLRKENGGVSTARNFGIKRSKSEYILLLDADDLFENTFMEKAVDILDSDKKIGVVSCYERFFYEDDFNNTILIWEPKGGGVENFLLESNASSSSLIRYQCWRDVGGFDEKLPSHEDWDFWIRVTSKGWMVYTMPEILFHYRRSKKSKYKQNVHRKPEFVKRIVENNADVYKEHVVTCLYEKEKEIVRLKEEASSKRETIKKSYPYIVGLYITYPFMLLKKAISIIKQKL